MRTSQHRSLQLEVFASLRSISKSYRPVERTNGDVRKTSDAGRKTDGITVHSCDERDGRMQKEVEQVNDVETSKLESTALYSNTIC